MLKTGEEILAEIDRALDQLIKNAELLNLSTVKPTYEIETETLQKTQVSLFAHLIHADQLLDRDKKGDQIRQKAKLQSAIPEKIVRLGELNAKLIDQVAKKYGAKLQVRKRRKLKVR